MESLLYVLIHLYNGTVPWQYVEVKKDDNFVNIMNYKRTTSSVELAKDMPNGFVKIVDYVRGLNFLDTPDYDYIRWCFKEIAPENNVVLDGKFWWQDDIERRADRTRLRSKSSKNINAALLKVKPQVNDDIVRRNNSLNKQRVICDMVKPLSKSRCFRVWTNSESVAGCRLFRWTSAYINVTDKSNPDEESKLAPHNLKLDVKNMIIPRFSSNSLLTYKNKELQKLKNNSYLKHSVEMAIPSEYSNEEDNDEETETFLNFEAIVQNLHYNEDHAQKVPLMNPHNMNLKTMKKR